MLAGRVHDNNCPGDGSGFWRIYLSADPRAAVKLRTTFALGQGQDCRVRVNGVQIYDQQLACGRKLNEVHTVRIKRFVITFLRPASCHSQLVDIYHCDTV